MQKSTTMPLNQQTAWILEKDSEHLSNCDQTTHDRIVCLSMCHA